MKSEESSKNPLHLVASLDGSIVKNDGRFTWMDSTDQCPPAMTLSDDDITYFLAAVDCYVMGSSTYEHAVEPGWLYGGDHCAFR
ncbi:MAG: hypothetical protein K9N11_03610 [Lentisphaeria bacterium]|nr:hypothetical protein [Candidatus Neomarinimicrobiota bacterium]MCF7841922.1 hypothetical protein [Lentisphaeria bacterium]